MISWSFVSLISTPFSIIRFSISSALCWPHWASQRGVSKLSHKLIISKYFLHRNSLSKVRDYLLSLYFFPLYPVALFKEISPQKYSSFIHTYTCYAALFIFNLTGICWLWIWMNEVKSQHPQHDKQCFGQTKLCSLEKRGVSSRKTVQIAKGLSQTAVWNLSNHSNPTENYNVCYQRGNLAILHSGNLFQQIHLSYNFLAGCASVLLWRIMIMVIIRITLLAMPWAPGNSDLSDSWHGMFKKIGISAGR